MSSTSAARRPRYQSQASNASSALNQSLSNAEAINLNESYSTSATSLTPLVTIIYSTVSSSSKDNQQLLLNSYASCRRLLEHLKPIAGVPFDEMIDLMDNEGKLKELNTHADDYASQYLSARHTYYVLKIEMDSTGEKRYIPSFNTEQIDQKLMNIFTASLNALNKSKRVVGKPKLNAAGQSSSNAPQTKSKRVSSRK